MKHYITTYIKQVNSFQPKFLLHHLFFIMVIVGLSSLRLVLYASIIFVLVSVMVSADTASKAPPKSSKDCPKKITFHIGAECKQATARKRSSQEQHVEQSVTFRDNKGDNAFARCRAESG